MENDDVLLIVLNIFINNINDETIIGRLLFFILAIPVMLLQIIWLPIYFPIWIIRVIIWGMD